jgi:4-hydroxy-tetrahydrodipicolinate reductase
MPLRLGFYGFGAIGRLTARVAIERGFEIIGAVDINPNILGKDVGELAGVGRLGVRVTSDPASLAAADVVVHATGSFLDKVYPQLLELIEMGLDVISTCETLAYPWYRYPVLARKLDERARGYGATILGTGVNPGFILDTLVVVLSASLPYIDSIRAVRSLDAAKRREPFRRKVGIGMDPDEYRRKLESGELTGHVGYAESVMLVAEALGVQPTKVVEAQEPVIAETRLESSGVVVEKGRVAGIRGYGAAFVKDREVVRVELRAYVGAEEFEEIRIDGGEYGVTWRSSGTPGDVATASIVLSLAEAVAEAPPGLLTMLDMVAFRPRARVV